MVFSRQFEDKVSLNSSIFSYLGKIYQKSFWAQPKFSMKSTGVPLPMKNLGHFIT